MKVQPAVRQETKKIALGTAVLTVLMVAVFLILRRFDWTVITGALLGYAAAVGNFFLMALTVQKAADDMKPIPQPETDAPEDTGVNDEEEKDAPLSEDARRGKQRIQLSYMLRMLGLGVIAILGVTLPCVTIPVTPGRNLAVILELAAMNNRQKKMGYNAAEMLAAEHDLAIDSGAF